MTSRSTGRIRLIVHAGTSKTGTSTLQFYLNRNRAALLQAGILYPLEGTQELRAPKHQWMVSPPMSARLPELRLSRDNQDGDARQSGWECRCGVGGVGRA